MPEIRKLKETEFDEALSLSEYAFQYKLKEEDIQKKKEALKKFEILGEFEDNNLLAKVHIIPFRIFMKETVLDMGGIASVATWPEHRRNRSVARLLKAALENMKEKKQTVSLLAPFSIGFYRQFGWELTAVLKKCTIHKSDLRFIGESNGRMQRVSKKDGYEVVNTIYETYAKQYNGMLVRTDDWWDNNVYSNKYQTAVYFDDQNQPTGYILYNVQDSIMDVQEFIYLNHEARMGLWNFICQHDSMVEKVKLILPEDDQLPFLLHNPRIQQELSPHFMARIVDVKEFFKQFNGGSSDPIAIRVRDSVAEWNNGILLINEDGASFYDEKEWGQTQIESVNELLETDIYSLTAMLFGAQHPRLLNEVDRLSGSNESVNKLEEWLKDNKSTFLDYF